MNDQDEELSSPSDEDIERAKKLRKGYETMTEEIGKFIVGQEKVLEELCIALLSRGHCLLEGVPGLAKTAMARCLGEVMDLSFRRIQFTPDLMPADVTGTDIIQENKSTGERELVFEEGPIFAQLVLADEINRTPPKTQAALLEAMEERSVTVGGETRDLDEPFFVVATQNPIEQEGTYPLPEAQKDRFMFHVKVDYPNRDQERVIIDRTTTKIRDQLDPVITGDQIVELQRVVRRVPVPDHVTEYVLDIVRKLRPENPYAFDFVNELVGWGPGPRACQHLVLAGKVRSLLKGRYHVTVDDIKAVVRPGLRHRVVPTFNAEAEGIDVEDIIDRILEAVSEREVENVM